MCQSHLTGFDVMLSGYAPNAAAVEAVGAIGIDLQRKAKNKPGSFFWGKYGLHFCPVQVLIVPS